MNELIKVVENGDEQTVSARDLHEALEVKRDFSTWIKDRIEKYGFAEGEDYHLDSPNLGNQDAGWGGDRRSIDYLLSVDMAKEVAMVENNEKGREIRRYLIRVEKAWNSPDLVLARAGVLDRIDKLEAQQKKFEGFAVAAYKKLEARVDGAYKEVLNNAVENATSEVREYLLTSHRPSAHEAQITDLKQYLSLAITATGDRRDKVDLFRLYPGYEVKAANPMPKDAFAAHVVLLYPDLIKFSGGVFSGCRFDY